MTTGRPGAAHLCVPYDVQKQAVDASQLWAQVEPLLVLGENVGQAAQFATTGAADHRAPTDRTAAKATAA